MKNIKNKTIIKYGLLTIFLCFILGVVYYKQYSLDETIFLKHYYDKNIDVGSSINIHFIEGFSDNRKILNINFPQMSSDFASSYIYDYGDNFNKGYYWSRKFANYKYNILTVALSYISSDEMGKKEKSVTLDKAIVTFNNGEKQEVDIGKIVLHKNVQQSYALTSTMVRSSFDNKRSAEMISNANFVINNITSFLDEEIIDILHLKMEGISKDELNYPIDVTTEDSLTFESQFIFDSKDLRKYNVYDIETRVLLTDLYGKKEIVVIPNIIYEPIHEFINEKGMVNYLNRTESK